MHTITVWSDVGCPWAHVAVSRLHRTRHALGLDDVVRFDHRAFPLELFNEAPESKDSFDAEVPVLGGIEPDAGWQPWQAPVWHWPATTVPAMEAVQAAKEQSLEAGEQLDRALRTALFAESRCISLRPVIVEVARRCPAVDPAALATVLDSGTARRVVMDDFERASADDVKGSPHVFLPDGTGMHNPGIDFEWHDSVLRITGDEPGVYEELLLRATS
jgi:predicted DsbA family dithiol-disulfide isomerase